MKKYELDLRVAEHTLCSPNYCLLKLTSECRLPEMQPGQFVEIRVDGSSGAFLRRPISIHFVDRKRNELWLLIQLVGPGTSRMAAYQVGESVNLLMPLGNGFSIPCESNEKRLLLIGGGVGVAPLLYLGDELKQAGYEPVFLLGARKADDLVQLDDFQKLGVVHVTTEDWSMGEQGYVTDHSVLQNEEFDRIYTCGPKAMMVAIARYAASNDIPCEVSLENTMACGIGACLCCVEQTKEGHKCVCTEGPVFTIEQLTWLS